MKISFLTFSSHGKRLLDTDYCDANPVGGSETACAYAVEYFRAQGHEVDVLTSEDELPQAECDVFVSLREIYPFFQKNISPPGKLNYLWCQDDASEPFLDPFQDKPTADAFYAKWDGLIIISHYQRQHWQERLYLPTNKIFQSRNGIPGAKFAPVMLSSLSQRPRRAYYSSSAYRGLNILLSLWPQIREFVPDAELLLFTAIQNPEENREFQPLYDLAKNLPGVTYQPQLGQAELRRQITTCRVMAYPATFDETGCIAAMEALASGCVVCAPARGALPETAWHNPLTSPAGEQWMDYWLMEVCKLLLDDRAYVHYARRNLHLARLLDWNDVFKEWQYRFEFDANLKGLSLTK